MPELSPAPAELTVTPSVEDGVPVLGLAGELDMSNTATLKAAIATAGADDGGRLVFDVSDLRFIDSAGIAVLLEAAERMGSVSLRAPAPVVRRVIEVTGLTEVLPFEE
jgi:anti-sigma B factor antagonist